VIYSKKLRILRSLDMFPPYKKASSFCKINAYSLKEKPLELSQLFFNTSCYKPASISKPIPEKKHAPETSL
jgi:hypothetical protein